MNDALIQAWVHTLQYEARDIIRVELRAERGELPSFSAGSHIDLHLPNGMIRSYSLLNDPRETHRYVLGVLKDRASRGGSRCVHEQLRVGMRLDISSPRNHFPLHEEAKHSVLIAGGIGITPIWCMAQRLKALNASFELIALARSRDHAALVEDVRALDIPVTWHFDDEHGGVPNLVSLLGRRSPDAGTHHYACGPAVMLEAFEAACRELGHAHVHLERFTAKPVEAAADARQQFTVELRQSGITFEVMPDETLHQRLLDLGIGVPFSCEQGLCGSCQTPVLEGVVDHRDSVLTPQEQQQNSVMMVCVSGCKSDRLVLDL